MSYGPGEPLHQGGNDIPLHLAEIDPKLAQQGKSVEDITNPQARLLILWTTIGQYRASGEMHKQDDDSEFSVNDARYHQLMSTWAREARRLDPLIRFSEFPNGVTESIEQGNCLKAYEEITIIRGDMPELMHPDIRFSALDILRRKTKSMQKGRLLGRLIAYDMQDESMPGREGHCDDAERLNRYLALVGEFPWLAPEIRDFVHNVQLGPPSQYFYNQTPDMEDLCNIVAKRQYTNVANYLVRNVDLGIEGELKLINLIHGK